MQPLRQDRDSAPRRPACTAAWMIALLGVLPAAPPALAADTASAPPDVTQYLCTVCTFNYGWHGSADFGVDYASGANYRFGEYTGYYQTGAYLDLAGSGSYRDAQGNYFDGSAGNLGLDSRWVDLAGGHQGLYELYGTYRQIPQFLWDSGQTPYLGAGGTSQTLPTNWINGGTTGQMSTLGTALHPVDISNQRYTVGVGAVYNPATHWDVKLDYRHDQQSGNGIGGANFLTNSAQLAAPIDFTTDQIDASVGYARGSWQARLGYYGSFFSDGQADYDWANAFTPLTAGATEGQMSLPPNNSFNQLALTGSWQILQTLRLMGSFAYGRESQNSTYIPSTINPQLATAPLPESSLSGEVNTGNYVVRLNATPAKHFFVNLEYLEDRRDNNTSQNSYQQVVTDTFIGQNQINLPYSFDRFDTKINAGYRILPNWEILSQIKLQIGGDYQRFDRTFEEVLRNHTDTVWGEFDANFAYGISAMLKYTYARRLLDDYQTVPGLTPPQNPLMMQYNTADRARDQWMATLSFNPLPKIGLDLIWLEDDDRYDDTVIGLTRDNEYSYTANLSWNPKEKITFNAYYTHEVIWTSQAGSQSFSVPDWNGSNNVQIDTVGVGLQWKNALPRLDLGLDYDWAYSNQATSVVTGSSGVPGFPENSNRDLIAKLWTRYQLNTRWALRFDYEYAKENTADWALSGVDPATISNVLALGVIAPHYDVNLFRLRAQYTF